MERDVEILSAEEMWMSSRVKAKIVTHQSIHCYNVKVSRVSFLMIIVMFAALWGCSVAPSEGTVAWAITDYFENGRYKVVDLKIGRIEGMPLSEKTYMGTPGYVVDIASITLEPQADKGIDIKKGKQLTFSNARIRVIQDMANKNVWHVFIISGISVP
ncbi:MAG: hypothetical protein ABSA46_17280 [Thermodesulfovibrionales bacterium]